MQEIFKEVLTKEDEAARIVGEAEKLALDTAAEAEKSYNGILKAARERSREKVSAGTEEIRRDEDARVSAALAEYEAKWNEMRSRGDSRVEELAGKLARMTAETN